MQCVSRTFYIIDGHAQIYRAYFAPFRDLTSPSGEPTKATFVFTQMLINLVEARKPDYLAMVIDSGEDVFRSEIYPQYKANRESPPDDFFPQEQRILRITRDAGVPIFAVSGYEADDLIATMTRRLAGQGFDVALVSKDKDLRQLLSDNVRMYEPQTDEFFDVQRLAEKCGFTPQQAVDVQTLMGDAIDNVPGVPGVGEKTAVKLICKYGSIDAIFEHIDELTPKLRENLLASREQLPIARRLVMLKDDVPMDFDPEQCRFTGLRTSALKAHLKELGFWSLLKRIGGDEPEPPATQSAAKPSRPARSSARADAQPGLFGPMSPEPAAPSSAGIALEPCTGKDCDYQLIDTPEKFETFLSELKQQKRFAFDTETDALGAMNSRLIGMSFSWKPEQGFYIPVRAAGRAIVDPTITLEALRPILADERIRKVGHNLKYDLMVVRQAGLDLRGIEMDTMIAAFLLDPSRMQYGIDRLALEFLNFRKVPTSDLIGKGKGQISMEQADLDAVARYAAEDADIALRLADLLSKRLDEIPAIRKLHDELETPLIEVLATMEMNGVAVDESVLKEQSAVLGQRVETLRDEIHRLAGGEFNIDSPKQLGEVLFNRLKLRVIKKTSTGGWSTDVEVLEKLASEHPVPKLILEYRQLVKLKNTYLDNLPQYISPRTGRIHASFSQIGAATGRLSCSDPNLQNIPIRTDEGQRIRLAFVPGDRENNVLLSADYSQIELRVLAHFTEEPALVRAFEQDEDIHRAVAAEVFGVSPEHVTREQRAQAKIINFGIIYGVTAMGLARRIEGLSVQAAQELIQAYNRRFPSIARFLNECVMHAQSHGYVETMLGRRRPLPDIKSGVVNLRNAAERMAINSVIQGTAADMIKLAMLRIHRRIQRENRPSRMLLQVHDELVFETPADTVEQEAAWIEQEMTAALKLKVPVKAEVRWGKNWREGK
jgi:DNA polymerase-1